MDKKYYLSISRIKRVGELVMRGGIAWNLLGIHALGRVDGCCDHCATPGTIACPPTATSRSEVYKYPPCDIHHYLSRTYFTGAQISRLMVSSVCGRTVEPASAGVLSLQWHPMKTRASIRPAADPRSIRSIRSTRPEPPFLTFLIHHALLHPHNNVTSPYIFFPVVELHVPAYAVKQISFARPLVEKWFVYE
jgi:hypothetical protein